MLDKCAPDWRYEDKQHKRWIYYGDHEPFKFPMGPHGKQHRYDIEMGHVKSLVKHLGIQDCAKRELQQLR